MLQKDKSITPSIKFNTSNISGKSLGLETPVQFVKGVGPKLSAVFSSRGINTVRDLLTFFPRTYEDRSQILKISDLKEGMKSSVSVKVIGMRQIPIRGGRRIYEAKCTDGNSTITLKWFHAPHGLLGRLIPGSEMTVTGTVKGFLHQKEMIHPEINFGSESSDLNVGRVVPIYVEIDGVPSRFLRKILWTSLEKYSTHLTEDLPSRYLQKHQLPSLKTAVQFLHFPDESQIPKLIAFNTPAHWRLIYEEFFKFEFLVLRQRLHLEKEVAIPFGNEGGKKALEDLTRALPFQLTSDQKKVLQDISGDLSQSHPMNRLIQGDVGSGKTAVVFLAAGVVLAEGGQAALMAPTEILAEQHYLNAKRLFSGKLNVAFLTGQTPQAERKILFERLGSGEPLLLIGTHALLEEPVQFKNLGLVLIDEQHRFGVEQRRTLRKKGRENHPHILILTATPIPRTLALTAYGDLSVSSIREMPPGRSPVITQIFNSKSKTRAYEKIRGELRKGHQAYFIYPLINESEAEGFTHLKAAISEAEFLAKEIFPEFKIGLLHGQLKSEEKTAIMEEFKNKKTRVLVSTTVVEVGVDVPNATVMVVEHAERFGLSQLHQLRGRVGRGSAQSYCFFIAHHTSGELNAKRLDVLESTQDGFKIAEADLEIRGPGDFLGTKQSGGLPFRLANLIRDQEWLIRARDDAQELLTKDPNLEHPEHLPLKKYYIKEGGLQFDRLKTS